MFKSRLAAFISSFLLLVSSSALVAGSLMPRQFAQAGKFSGNATTTSTQHYLYVFPDGNMYVYDIDNNFALVSSTTLPTTAGVRGVAASPATGMLYVSYGGDGGSHGNGSLLQYDLVHNTIGWQQNYSFGIDQPAITPDGKTLYMPDGAASSDGIWHIIDAATGNVTGSINAGISPHNTIVSLNGQHVYLGGLNHNFLERADTSTNQVTTNIGPLTAGVRPFTINGTETYAFTTATNTLGFQVSNIATGNVMYTVSVPGFSGSTSHGISLSPDETQVYLMDASNSYVHVFSLTQGFPNSAPVDIKDIPLNSMSGSESPCAYDCQREGWVLHSGDGKYVFVCDSGDIVNTATMTPLPRDTSSSTTVFNTLDNTRKLLEIDWTNSAPSFTTSRFGLGYVTSGGPTPTPTPTTPTASPSPTTTATMTPSPSPTPGATLAQDTFQRPNQALWGTASDGHIWGGDANTASVFSIVNNTGQVSNSSGIFNAVLGSTATDGEVLFSGSMSSFNNTNLGAVLRWSNTNNWYKAYINGTTLVVQKKVNGTTTIIGSASFAATAGTSNTLRFRVVSTTLYAKVWRTGTTEPTNWMITVTDTTFSSGFCGLRMQIASGVTASYTSFLATVPGGTATPTPTPSPTLSPSPSPSPSPTPSPSPSPTPSPSPSPSPSPTPSPSPSPTPSPGPSPSPTVTVTASPSPTVTTSPSPTPGSILAQDTFHRPNQALWGMASDGHVWGGDANVQSAFSIVNNTGQVSNTSTTYSAVLGPVATNAEVLFSGSMSNYTNNNLGAVLRWKDTNNWYKAYINGTSLVVQKRVNGATTIIGSVSFAATAGTSYTLRFRVVGTTLYAKVWRTGTTEPTNWMIMVTDTTFSSGYCGLRMLAQNGATASYTSFLATAQ